MLNPDYAEILSTFLDGHVEFVLVGAYAMAAHGYPRATGDIDLFVNPSHENARRVYECLAAFGAPIADLAPDDLVSRGTIFQIGVAPRRIDILTTIDGVEFEEAFRSADHVDIDGLRVPVISKPLLIRNKVATGREKDRLDAEILARRGI